MHVCLYHILHRIVSYRIGSLSSVCNLQLYGCFALYLLILCSRRTLNSQMWFELLWRCFVHIAHPKFAQCLNFWHRALLHTQMHRAHLHTQMHRHTHTHSVCEVQANEIVLGTTEFETVCICERTWPQMLRLNIESLKLIISPKYGRKRHHPSMSGLSCLKWATSESLKKRTIFKEKVFQCAFSLCRSKSILATFRSHDVNLFKHFPLQCLSIKRKLLVYVAWLQKCLRYRRRCHSSHSPNKAT